MSHFTRLGWFCCVLGAARGYSFLGALVALFLAAVHLLLAGSRKSEAMLMLGACLLGVSVDSAQQALGSDHLQERSRLAILAATLGLCYLDPVCDALPLCLALAVGALPACRCVRLAWWPAGLLEWGQTWCRDLWWDSGPESVLPGSDLGLGDARVALVEWSTG